MDEMTKDQKAVADATEIINLEQYGVYTDFNECTDVMKRLLEYITKLEKENIKCTDKEWKTCQVEKMGCKGCYYEKSGSTYCKDCGSDLEKYIEKNTCLHCAQGKPRYCEDCYQDLIGINAKLQNRIFESMEIEDVKNKMIDEMANAIGAIMTDIPVIKKQFEEKYCEFITSDDDFCIRINSCSECIKSYFEKKVLQNGKRT